jgi:hypothetical protein
MAQDTAPAPQTIEPEKTLFTWRAPARPFVRRDKRFWIRAISIISLFAFILYVAEGSMPVILTIAIVFLYYVLSSVEPEEINFSLTNYGVKIADKTTSWSNLTSYWFSTSHATDILVFHMNIFPQRLEMVINKKDIPSLKKELNKYVVQEELPPSKIDRASNWFSQKLEGKTQ